MIDIVIPSRWRTKLLVDAVKSVLDLAHLSTTDVIVACDIDDPETIETVRQLQNIYEDRVKYIISPYTGSVVKSVNMAFKVSTKEFVGVICDDGYLTYPGWDEHVEMLFTKHKEYGCLRIQTHDANGRDTYLGIPYPFTFIIKNDVFKALGYLNEQYNHFGPDTHLGMQMLMENVLMMTSKNVVLHHIEVADDLHAVNFNKLSMDNPLFHSIWDSQTSVLLEKYESVKDKWGAVVE